MPGLPEAARCRGGIGCEGRLWGERTFDYRCSVGGRFAERILTVMQTLRLQKHRVLDFPQASLQAHPVEAPGRTLLAIQ
jgi:hypothetical protein